MKPNDNTTEPLENPEEDSGTTGNTSFTAEQFFEYSQKIVNKAKKEVEAVLPKIYETLDKVKKDLETNTTDIKTNKSDIIKQSSRNIEIIGIFSAILALLIIDVSIIKGAPNFLAAILLITGLTASLLIFASLIHILFSHNEKRKHVRNKSFWGGVITLIILIIVGIIFHALGWDLYNSLRLSNPPSQIEAPQDEG